MAINNCLQVQRDQQVEKQQSETSQSSADYTSANAEQKNQLLGVAYSPSNQVSQVKYSSNAGLNYNF